MTKMYGYIESNDGVLPSIINKDNIKKHYLYFYCLNTSHIVQDRVFIKDIFFYSII